MISNGLTINANIKAKAVRESNQYVTHNLKVGETYQVEEISMGQSRTSIGINGKSYNSVIFEFYENGEKIDIYKDERFNPYISLFRRK